MHGTWPLSALPTTETVFVPEFGAVQLVDLCKGCTNYAIAAVADMARRSQ